MGAALEGTPAPARGRALVSSLVEGALVGRAIWDVVWLRGRVGATTGRAGGLVEVTLEEEAVREAGAVDVVDGARLRGLVGPEGGFAVVGIERVEEVARMTGRLDVCLCWIAGVGRT